MTPFLESVAKYIYEAHKNELHEIAIVFPNKRARLFFNQNLGRVADRPVFAPRYYTITEYFQKLSRVTVADQVTLLFVLYEEYVLVTGSNESFDQFLYYCEMLLADFDDLDKNLVDASMLYKNLSDIKEIDDYYDYLDEAQIKAIEQFWRTFLQSRDSEEKQKFSKIWNVLLKIYWQFNEKLEDKAIGYEGRIFRKAIENIKSGTVEIREKKVAFVGFNALNKCEKELFSFLQKLNKQLFFWDYDEYYIKRKDFHEAAYFLADLLKQFPPPTGFNFDSLLVNKDRTINIIDIATTTGQAKVIPNIIDCLPIDWKNEPYKTAIALADESLLIPVLSALPDNISEVNISMGYPLKETKVYNLVQALLELQKNKKASSNKGYAFYHKDVIQLLQVGIFNVNHQELVKIEGQIKIQNLVYVSSKILGGLSNIYNKIFIPDIAPDSFTQYLLDILKAVPDNLRTENKNTYTIENEACFRIINQLTRITDILKQANIKYSFGSLARLLLKILEGTSIPFSGEPLLGLQLMGVLETRNLDFDNLVILSMNEGVFPKSGNVPSFIPYSLRKGFEMPTIEHQDAIFAYYFYRLLQRSSTVTLVYSSSVTDSKSGEPSRFIHQLNYEDYFETRHESYGYNINPVKKKRIVIEKTEEIRNVLKENYTGKKSRPLSPSAVNTYLNCKTRFYYRYIAKLKEPVTILEEVEANTLGSILHKVMENLYGPYIQKVINKEDIQSIIENTSQVEDVIIKAFWSEYISPEQSIKNNETIDLHGKNTIVKEVIRKYVTGILNYDLNNAPFRITGLEKEYYSNIEIKDFGTITIGGVIDRTDYINEQLRIVDYKSGKLKDSFPDIEQLFCGEPTKRNDAAFQTLLYSMVVAQNTANNNIRPALYFARNIKQANYSCGILIGQRQKKKVMGSYNEVRGEFEENLLRVLTELFSPDGHFEQTEDLKYCEYCPYKAVCSR